MVIRSQTSKDISYFATDLEKIRAKPSLYIGLTDGDGIFNLWRELLDNGIDEARAKRNNYVGAWYDGTYFWVLDQGQGIPVTTHKKAKISTFTHALTNLQSSGKMQKGAYDDAIGTHGTGLKCVTALSSDMQAWTYRKNEGGWWSTSFAEGKETKKPFKCKPPKFNKVAPKQGTLIRFIPSKTIFGNSKIDFERVKQWASITAYMNPKTKIQVINPKGKTNTYYSTKGIIEFVGKIIVDNKLEKITDKLLLINSKTLELAVAFTSGEENIKAYTNTVSNIDGGVHLEAFHKAYADVLKQHMGAKDNFTPSNAWEGLVGILNYKINAPQFSGQTKEKLVDVRVKLAAYNEFKVEIEAFFSKNKPLAKELCKKATELQSLTEKFKASKKLVGNVRKAARMGNSKLSDIIGKAPTEKREIFIVEGDSAAGGARQGRDPTFQAVYPLRGKPLNVMEAPVAKINENKEIVDLLAAIGVDLGKDEVKSRYGKIIILADSDKDGEHISVLLLCFFWKFTPQLFKQGRIYIANAPLYRCVTPKGTFFSNSRKELRKQYGKAADITYLKGMGELQPNQLKQVAMDPKTRGLIQITYPKSKKETKDFEFMLGKDSNFKKKMLGISRELVK